jgi:hypothetical protein
MPDDLSLDPELRDIALRYFAAVEASRVPSSLTVADPSLERGRRGFGLGRGLATVAVFAAVCAVLIVVVVAGRSIRATSPTRTAQGGPSSRVCPSLAAVPREGPVPPRSAAAMAYDGATGQLVLFGGDTSNGKGVALGDTWIWNGTTWSQRDVSPSPPGRIGAAMAYDPASRQLLLFSGTGATPEDDTWIWDGVAWHEVRPATNPPPRTDAAIAYDPAIGRIVMFGGWNPDSSGQPMYDDTWTWDGTNWTKLLPSTAPPARAEAVMAYDVVSRALVMFGGEGDVAPYSNETWVFDGRAWALAHFPSGAAQPAARDATVMAADDANHTIVLFGGEESGGNNNDTWTWNGSEWMQVHPRNAPPARGVETESGMMAYDPELHVDVLYGGPVANPQGSLGDTWTWNGLNWTEVANNGPGQPARGSC